MVFYIIGPQTPSSHNITPENRRFGLCYRAAVLPPDELSIALSRLKVNISKYKFC